jgi:maltose/maltodextrin transport system permease protein
MILIVNTWLGYPYIMICVRASSRRSRVTCTKPAIAGAKPLTNFFKITAPLIAKPLTPLLISAFAFNFNNFVLISLLTDGRPDYLNTKLPAGTTDILVSYTYRIAFTDSGQNFGLAAAISTLIFVMVAFLIVISVSLRPGNFASGSLIPQTISLEHWRFVLGLSLPPGPTAVLPDLPVAVAVEQRSRWR